MGVIKNKKTEVKKAEKPEFAKGFCKVNIQPDLILQREKGKKQMFVYKAFNENQDKSLPIFEREFFIVSEKRVTTQRVGNSDYTIWSKTKGHNQWGEVQTTLKQMGWLNANQIDHRKEIQRNGEQRAAEKAKMRKVLRKKGLLDEKDNPINQMVVDEYKKSNEK